MKSRILLTLALLGTLLLLALFIFMPWTDDTGARSIATAPATREAALPLVTESSRPPVTGTAATAQLRAERITRYRQLQTRLALASEAREARESASHREAGRDQALLPPPGALGAEYIHEQMQDIVPLIKECYEMALETEPELAGKVVVRWTIIGEPEVGGLVESSEVMPEESEITSPDFLLCVQESIYAIELDAPEGGGRVTVNYPMIFASAE